VERFNRTALDSFLRPAFRQIYYELVAALQKDLDKWLRHDNLERVHQGYRNRGARPIDTVLKFAKKPGRKVSLKKPRRSENSIFWRSASFSSVINGDTHSQKTKTCLAADIPGTRCGNVGTC